jgi:hypothetical protein
MRLIIDWLSPVALRPAAGHVLRVWRGLVDRLRLALITAVAPHLALLAVQ